MENRHSDIGGVPMSTLEFIPISDIKRNINSYPLDSNPRPMLLLASAIPLSYCADL
jgi:hypothetical protein